MVGSSQIRPKETKGTSRSFSSFGGGTFLNRLSVMSCARNVAGTTFALVVPRTTDRPAATIVGVTDGSRAGSCARAANPAAASNPNTANVRRTIIAAPPRPRSCPITI